MKITKQDYSLLKTAIAAVESKITLAEYRKEGLSDTRYRWDLFHLAAHKNSELYRLNLDDSHIDTALRKIVKELEQK